MKTLLLTTMIAFAFHANAEVYKLDTAESKIGWKATKKVTGGHNGSVAVQGGEVEVNSKNEVVKGTVVAEMKTIVAEDLAADPDSQKKFAGHITSPDFFDVAKYPTSKFELTSVTNGIAKGNLTFIGQTHPVEFPLKTTVANGVAKGEGTLKVDRTKWGLKYGSGSLMKLPADKIINDEFELTFNLVAKKDAAKKDTKKK